MHLEGGWEMSDGLPQVEFGPANAFDQLTSSVALVDWASGRIFADQEEATMEQRVSIITLGVTNLDRSREFYERLGWRRSMAHPQGIVFFQVGGMALALFPRPELAKDANIAPDGHGFSGVSLAFNTRNREDVDSVLAEAEAAGAKILKHGEEAFWSGYSGYFSDPDGFLWEVAWNPSFPMDEDGSIRIPD
jgi:catechol 2,3-dioxygenase-like lactoylglutathione lyase family enzyme